MTSHLETLYVSKTLLLVVPCDSQPCQNGGTCRKLSEGFQCDCLIGMGLMCEGGCHKSVLLLEKMV